MFAMHVGFYSLSTLAKNRSSLQIGSMMLSRTMTSLIASSPERFKMDVHVRLDIRSEPDLELASCLLQRLRELLVFHWTLSHKQLQQISTTSPSPSLSPSSFHQTQRERALTKSYMIFSPTAIPTTQPEPCRTQRSSTCNSQSTPTNPRLPCIQDLEESHRAEGSVDHVLVSFAIKNMGFLS